MAPKYFTAKEVFHPSFIAQHGHDVWFLRPAEIWTSLDALREAWGKPIIINGPTQRYCGVRPLDSTVGAKRSRHKPLYDNVQAFDLHGRTRAETDALYAWIVEGGWRHGNVERLEHSSATPGWVHVEISVDRPHALNVFYP